MVSCALPSRSHSFEEKQQNPVEKLEMRLPRSEKETDSHKLGNGKKKARNNHSTKCSLNIVFSGAEACGGQQGVSVERHRKSLFSDTYNPFSEVLT